MFTRLKLAVFCKVTANGFTGFWIYFVSMTLLSLQIKSKLIFLTATWVLPVGVCRASCVPSKAGTRNGTGAACWRPERAPKGREQISKYLLDSTGVGGVSQRRQILFSGRRKGRQDLCGLKDNGRNTREPIWTHILRLPLTEMSNGPRHSLGEE